MVMWSGPFLHGSGIEAIHRILLNGDAIVNAKILNLLNKGVPLVHGAVTYGYSVVSSAVMEMAPGIW